MPFISLWLSLWNILIETPRYLQSPRHHHFITYSRYHSKILNIQYMFTQYREYTMPGGVHLQTSISYGAPAARIPSILYMYSYTVLYVSDEGCVLSLVCNQTNTRCPLISCSAEYWSGTFIRRLDGPRRVTNKHLLRPPSILINDGHMLSIAIINCPSINALVIGRNNGFCKQTGYF